MRFPIKLNRDGFPSWCCKCLPCKGDPRKLMVPETCGDSFEFSISAIKIGETWKSTQKKRHILSDRLIVGAASSLSMPSVLEIGASSGSTSMELLDSLGNNYGHYYVTDLYFELRCVTRDGVTYLYHPNTGECIMRVTDRFLIYNEVGNALFPQGMIANRLIKRAPQISAIDTSTVNFLHPELRRRIASDTRIIATTHNVLEPWPHELLDIVKVANVLNRLYFSDEQIMKALMSLKVSMKPEGKLVITDNREVEMASMFCRNRDGKFALETEINGGTEIADLVKRC